MSDVMHFKYVLVATLRNVNSCCAMGTKIITAFDIPPTDEQLQDYFRLNSNCDLVVLEAKELVQYDPIPIKRIKI